jgi:GTPase SAR1 family protein
MERKEILTKIEKIKQEIEAESCDLIREKILQREYHQQISGRSFFFAFLINKLRRRLIVEMNHILDPILDNQREINLRLLKEVEQLKKSHEQLPQVDSQDHPQKR